MEIKLKVGGLTLKPPGIVDIWSCIRYERDRMVYFLYVF